jgi:hypothetical protein
MCVRKTSNPFNLQNYKILEKKLYNFEKKRLKKIIYIKATLDMDA